MKDAVEQRVAVIIESTLIYVDSMTQHFQMKALHCRKLQIGVQKAGRKTE
jgi:hypothetical protein